MLFQTGLILLAAAELAMTSPIVRDEAHLSYTSDPRNIAYTQELERIIADGVTGNTTDTGLEKRAAYCVLREGDGNPHQNPRHTQISRTGTCGNAGCSVSLTAGNTETYESTWSLNPPSYWINAGFTVEKSIMQSEAFTCNGNPHETICIWSVVGTTAYTVGNYDRGSFDTCGALAYTSIIFSPNECNNTPNYYCVAGASNCRTLNQFYYDTNNAPATAAPTC